MRDLEAQLRSYGAILDGAEPALTDVADAPVGPARRSLIVAVAAVVVVAITASAIAITATRSGDDHRPNVITPSSGPPNPTPTTRASATGKQVLALGDSVMEGAKGALEKEMPGITVDAALSRQFHDATAVLARDESVGARPVTVVVAFGTNGRVTSEAIDAFMRAAGELQVYFVTVRVPRLWESEVNDALRAAPKRWPKAHVIDWHEFANGHDDWFVADGFHLSSAGQGGYAILIASALGLLPKPTPYTPSGLNVVALEEGELPPAPLAVAGGGVWIAATDYAGTAPFVRLERRDPTTTKLLARIDVHQEAVFGIAGDGDTLWVAGGGDGGVPETTVSRVDVRTGAVVFTKTLTGTPCSCPIVAGRAGVWLVGNGSDYALHLSSTDGHVIANVRLPKPARAAMETSSRLLIGLDDGSVAAVDPATNRVERLLPTQGTPSTGPVTAMGAPTVATNGSVPAIDGFITHTDGKTFALFASTGAANEFLKVPFVPTAVADVHGFMWVFGGDRLLIQPTHGERPTELAYDLVRHRFDKVTDSSASQVQGFRNAVVVGDRLWVVYDDRVGRHGPSIVVVEIPVVRKG